MKIARIPLASRRRRQALPAIAGCLAVLAIPVAGCGNDDGAGGDGAGSGASSMGTAKAAPPQAKRQVTVDIASFKYKPETVKVKKGGTVTFINMDKAPHTAQTELNPKTATFDTGRLAKGQKKAVKAADVGRFEYFCAYHRFMEGTIEVVE